MKNLKKLKYAFMAIYVLNVMLINFGIMYILYIYGRQGGMYMQLMIH